MKRKILILTGLVMGWLNLCLAQEPIFTNSGEDVLIEGMVADTSLEKTPNKEVELIISVSSFDDNRARAFVKKYNIKTTNRRRFKLVIPAPKKFWYVTFSLNGMPSGNYWSDTDNVYLFERGDHIQCILSNSYFNFEGKGAAKLQCQSEVYKLAQVSNGKKTIEANWDSYLSRRSSERDLVLNLQMAVIAKYESVMGKEMTEMMKANCVGQRYYKWFRAQSIYYSNASKISAFLRSSEYLNADKAQLSQLETVNLAMAPIYGKFLLQKIIMDQVKVVGDGVVLAANNKRLVFMDIKTKYRGLLREKLVLLFLLHYINSSEINTFFDESLALVNNVAYREMINSIRYPKEAGRLFYPFELEDNNGQKVVLNELKDKVVLIDFWYTGCLNCVDLHQAMMPIHEKYKNDQRVKFVTINVDRTKKMWLESVKKGLYTSKEAINLYAGQDMEGAKATHPLLKSYNVSLFPTLFILKDRHMYDANPPLSDMAKIEKLIATALQ